METRYSRHELIDWWDQRRLKSAKVLVAGAGAIGNEVIKLLALLGVGQILIVDFDRLELSNLTRSVLFREEDIGQPKAQTAAARAREINPDITVRAIDGDLGWDVGLGVYRAMDLAIGCLDSLQARLALNRACYRAGIPWLNGGIEATFGEATLYCAGKGPCFECAMSDAMWERRNARFSCGGLRADVPEEKMPTTAVVASLAAGYLVNEALLLLHAADNAPKEGLGFGQKLTFALKPYGFGIYDLPVNPSCLAHDLWEPVETLDFAPSALTAAALLRYAEAPNAVIELGTDLLTEMRCVGCGRSDEVMRPVEQCGHELVDCPSCRKPLRQPGVVQWLDTGSPYAERRLSDLGVADHQILALRTEHGRRFVQLSGAYSFTQGGTE